MTERWTDRIIGERMRLDEQFTEQVAASQFTRQQWGLIMTAVEFDIEHPDDDERARLVADTSALPNVVGELDRMENQSPMGPGGPQQRQDDDGGGLLDGVKSALGLDGSGGDGVDESDLAAAERLAQQYADELQAMLEERGKWQSVRTAASE
jgi:hypothetical protein